VMIGVILILRLASIFFFFFVFERVYVESDCGS
jgi:hypothetical protein